MGAWSLLAQLDKHLCLSYWEDPAKQVMNIMGVDVEQP